MRLLRALALVLALCTGWSVTAVAQLPTLPPPKPPVSGLTPRDTIPRTAADSARARKDTVATKDTVVKANFAPPDSVLQRLLSTPGYTPTRYQGEVITFDAVTRALQLTKKAVVQRGDSVLVKSDTISYNGSGSDIRVGTDSSKRGNLFVTSGQAPVFSSGSATYDLNSRRASVSGLKTTIPQSGEVLTITGERVTIAASKDTVKTKDDATYYVKNGTVTACDDSVPDYHFSATEIKRTGSFVVARPAVLYIGDVPVLWLPFLFQDIRSGRRSGLIAPNIGVSDIVRNSPSYRRNVEGLGYYVAINDYFDAQAALDWRSSAGETLLGDPGYMRYNGEFRYRWLERYVQGGVALSQTTQAGSRNTAISWTHGEQFTRNSSLQFNFNYVQNTTLQQQTTVNPYAVLATIASTANYQQKIGPAQISVGASQKQYPGRTELDRNFPTVSFTTAPLNLGSALTWTPSFNYASTLSKDIDQPSALGPLLRAGKTAAGLDTVFNDSTKRSAKTSTLTFDSPVVIFGYNIGLNLGLNSALNDFPEREIVTDVLTGVETERVYAQTYHTELNINPTFSLPALSRNSLNLGWSLSLANVDGSAYAIRNERTNGEWVHQSKRVSLGLSAAPTLFGMYEPGIGPFMKIRHSISPTLSFSFAPASDVSDQFLAAIGRSRYSRVAGQSGYLGALRQSSVTFGLSTNFEAKLRSLTDSNPDAGEKLKLLSLNFTPISYDFERAKATNSRIRGLTTQNFGYTIRSDLLPGVDIGVDYSLFSGSTLSDSAVFDPYRERITASWAFSNTANPFSVLAKIFGRQAATSTIDPKAGQAQLDDKYREQVQSQQVAGSSNRRSLYAPTIPQGWNASFNFTSARQRPPTGNALNVVAYDPAVQCSQFNTQALKVVYDECVARARTNPTPTTPITSGISGSTIYLTPPTTSLGSNVSFNLTEHWSASWQTQYDFEARNFASQVVSLQRDLHDWHAIFGFTQSPNGSFAFNFLVSLKAEPDLKFDYHKSTFRNEGIGR